MPPFLIFCFRGDMLPEQFPTWTSSLKDEEKRQKRGVLHGEGLMHSHLLAMYLVRRGILVPRDSGSALSSM